MHTARHIVKNCFQGPLAKDRTIILVTHHISLCLSASSYIVELSAGKVIRQGSISDLQNQGLLKSVVHDEDVTQSIPEKERDHDEPIRDGSERIQKKLVEEEYRKEWRVAVHTYLDYFNTSGWISWTLTFILMALLRAGTIANSVRVISWPMPSTIFITSFTDIPRQVGRSV